MFCYKQFEPCRLYLRFGLLTLSSDAVQLPARRATPAIATSTTTLGCGCRRHRVLQRTQSSSDMRTHARIFILVIVGGRSGLVVVAVAVVPRRRVKLPCRSTSVEAAASSSRVGLEMLSNRTQTVDYACSCPSTGRRCGSNWFVLLLFDFCHCCCRNWFVLLLLLLGERYKPCLTCWWSGYLFLSLVVVDFRGEY